MTPEKLGRYEILDELGKGAMGLVYLARDPLIGRQLALKTFRLGYSAKDEELEQFRARFLREAQSAGILSHPNIVTIHDVVVDQGGDFFIAMEYVKGTDLKQLMQRQGRLDVRFVTDIVAQIADGLDYAHSKGVVHRDIKPANIIITAEKKAKITDFGIARVDASNLTVEGQLLGTPNYMAPEQIQGKEVDHRADLFSLGVMLYEMVTSKKPFAGENLTVVTHRIVYDAFTPPDEILPGLPPRLLEVLDRALRKEPDERYQTGADLAADVRSIFEARDERRVEATTASFLTDVTPTSGAAALGPTPPSGEIALPDRPSQQATPRPSTDRPGAPAPGGGGSGAAPRTSTTTPATAGASPPRPGAPVAPSPAALSPAALSSAALSPAALSPTAEPTPRPAATAPASASPRSAPRNVLLIGAVAALLLAVLGTVAFFSMRSTGAADEVAQFDPEEELRKQYGPLVEEGEAAMAAGEPARAIELFDRALVVAPGDPTIRALRDRAEQMLLDGDLTREETMIRERLRRAEAAITARDYDEAIALAGSAAELDPENERARELLVEAEDAKRRREEARRAVKDRFNRGVATDSDRAETVAEQPAIDPATQTATLDVQFSSDTSEGILTIYVGTKQFYKESFKFTGERSGIFRRPRRISGTLSHRAEVPAGTNALRVYVWSDGAGTQAEELQGNFPPGRERVLRIQVDDVGEVTAALE